ncbi:hypothetical protein GCM10010300_04050 [Streptomyces olivaceoviridis]|uniref:hypothetical protein n=1 Tax=Streptomyces olivaceoviridis TaxID=1921 RepID=UPI00167272BD|nr:hypothetical protein [Streptomyces olivaceoviridis]GGY64093.1 hypothetical protein GCM10010300_04050 [Streptomyces olivaceoviridis]
MSVPPRPWSAVASSSFRSGPVGGPARSDGAAPSGPATPLYEALRGGGLVLITPEPYEAARPRGPAGRGRRASGRRTAVPVRPDGYAAWAADQAGPARTEAALARGPG